MPVGTETAQVRVFSEGSDSQTLLARARECLSLREGRLAAAALAPQKDGILAAVALNHLAADGISWRVLMEELEASFTGCSVADEEPESAASQWFSLLSHTAQFDEEASSWAEVLRTGVDLPNSASRRTHADMTVFECRLDAENTAKLLDRAGPDLEAALLGAFASGLSRWAGKTWPDAASLRTPLIWVEHHGREILSDDMPDTGDAVGWFTSLVPTAISGSTLEERLRAASASLSLGEANGLGFGVLAAYRENAAAVPEALRAGLCRRGAAEFNYLGRFDLGVGSEDAESALSIEQLGDSADQSPDFPAGAPLSITLLVNEKGELECDFAVDLRGLADPEGTGRYLKSSWKRALEEVIDALGAAGSSEGASVVAGVRLAGIALDPGQVEELQKLYGAENIEKVRPVSWREANYLVDRTRLPTRPPVYYIRQFRYGVEGDLDADLMRRSFRELTHVHSIFRTAFGGYGELSGKPFDAAVVLRRRDCEFVEEDLRELAAADMSAALLRVDAFIHRSQEAIANISTDSLLHFGLFRVGERSWKIACVFHHIIIDRWSGNLFFAELACGKVPAPESIPDYGDFARYEKNRNVAEDLDWWSEALRGVDAPGDMPGVLPFEYAPGAPHESRVKGILLEPELVGKLQEIAFDSGASMPALFCFAGGLLMAEYHRAHSPVWEVNVAGRTAPVEGLDRMMGTTMATMPVTFAFKGEESASDALARFQEALIDFESHTYVPLGEIIRRIPNWPRAPELTLNVESQPSFESDDTPLWAKSVTAEAGTNEGVIPYALVVEALHDGSGAVRAWLNYSPERVNAVDRVLTDFKRHVEWLAESKGKLMQEHLSWL